VPDLAALTLSDMVALSAALRRSGSAAGSMEDVAAEIVRRLYDELGDGAARNCVLVRFFKTHRLDRLGDTAQRSALGLAGGGGLAPSTRCLALLASAGDEPQWNDRRQSRGHQAVPLASEEIIERFPMIAQLLRQLGVETSALREADADLVVRIDEKRYNVFHVPVAVGSSHIPAQEDFVVPYGVQSVVGFGGLLASGDLFAVVLFSRAVVTTQTAELLEALALSVKVAVQPFALGPVFNDDAKISPAARPPRAHQVRAVEQLLEVHERTVELQAASLERAHQRELVRSQQLRALAETALLISLTLSLDQILSLVAERAREIIGAKQAVASLAVDADRIAGLDALVCESNRPLRLDQRQLEDHPRGPVRSVTATSQELPRGWLGAPLISRTGQNLGLLRLSDRHEGDFTSDDEAMIVQLAQLTSASIENALAFAREHDLSAALQQSLLPDALPEVAGLDVAARYLPGTADVEVGGDFYDVLQVSATEVALVIGDVAGHDVRAAITMGRTRHALHAYALEDSDPVSVLSRLNRFGSQEPDTFITALYALLDLTTGTVRMVNAGHPPALLVDGTGGGSFLACEPYPPIGVRARPDYREVVAVLPEGSTIVLYTDGLVERRGEDLEVGLARLRAAGGSAPAGTSALLDHLLDTLPGSTRPDDIALLAGRFSRVAEPTQPAASVSSRVTSRTDAASSRPPSGPSR